MSKKDRNPIVPFPHMEESNFTDEEIERFFQEMDAYEPEELSEKDQPVWLSVQEALHHVKDHIESTTGRYASDGMELAHSELVRMLAMARRAFNEEQVGPLSAEIIKDHLELLEDRWFEAEGMTDAVRRSYRSRVESGYKTGYAAQSEERFWRTYWDDRWLERRPNGKGWVYSTDQIIKALPDHAVHPKHSTVSRYRNKLAKSRGLL
jgi:hypothetical protein